MTAFETRAAIITVNRPPKDICVVVCTRNRARDVAECMAALAGQAGPDDVVIVDSASDPPHAETLRRLTETFPFARLVRLNEPGLSRARNAGLDAARASWVAFLDDDAVPDADWLARLSRALAAASPRTAMVGGKIRPLWPAGADGRHVTGRWKLLLSCVEGEEAGPVGPARNICGANFAVRKDAALAVRGFPAELGRMGEKLIGGEESYLIRRLQAQGYEVLYDPSFAVGHKIAPERLTLAWVKERAFSEGVTIVKLHGALREALPGHVHPVKLALSIPALWLAARVSRNADFHIRLALARGSFHARMRPNRPSEPVYSSI